MRMFDHGCGDSAEREIAAVLEEHVVERVISLRPEAEVLGCQCIFTTLSGSSNFEID